MVVRDRHGIGCFISMAWTGGMHNITNESETGCEIAFANAPLTGIPGGHQIVKRRVGRPAKSPVHYLADEHGCWVWQRGTNQQGYGRLSVDGRLVSAHRYYYEQVNGPIPTGMYLDHLCRNHSCVNPDHLEAVTHAVNVQRGNSAKLTSDQVADIRSSARSGEGSTSLSKRFGVSSKHVRRIITGQKWCSPPACVARDVASRANAGGRT